MCNCENSYVNYGCYWPGNYYNYGIDSYNPWGNSDYMNYMNNPFCSGSYSQKNYVMQNLLDMQKMVYNTMQLMTSFSYDNSCFDNDNNNIWNRNCYDPDKEYSDWYKEWKREYSKRGCDRVCNNDNDNDDDNVDPKDRKCKIIKKTDSDVKDYWKSCTGKSYDTSNYEYIERDSNNRLNMDSGIKKSNNFLKLHKDTNNDNKVSLTEYGLFNDIIDRDGNKYVTAGEDFALKSYIDSNCDGKINKDEMKLACLSYKDNSVNFSNAVNKIYYFNENSKGLTISDKMTTDTDLDKAIAKK